MFEILEDALLDSLRMIPFLFFIYMGIELIEKKLSHKLIKGVKRAGKVAPAMGAAFGVVPQCGFSVMATALYTKKIITVGTLMAVYLATSDEALPVILGQPEKIGVLFPLIATKVVIAIVAGYAIDFIMQRSLKLPAEGELCATSENIYAEESSLPGSDVEDEKGCCGHHVHSNKINIKELLLHPFIHTLKVFAFIFLTTLLINFVILQVGEENLPRVFLSNTIFQPIIASLFGLIPNCASSIAITQVFLQGGISFGSTVAGLSAGAGLGTLVLFRENKDIKDTFRILGMLVAISSVVGIIIQFIYG